ncbi:MAG: SIMPL domain-containing protein [Firmicutes bacterium]|nr:SIMPL domain-containing protein [Bacillota bacterium]
MDNKRTIRVTGKGSVSVKPDTTRLTVTLRGTYKDYQETLSRSARDTEALKDVLQSLGFERGELKTLSFDVDTRYESVQDQGRNFRQVFVGYEYTHMTKLDFPSDNELLGRTLYALAASELKPEFRLSYTVKDQEAVKNELLGRAVEDALAKARVLTRAAGVSLKEILNIDYSWAEVSFEVQPLRRSLEADMATGVMNAKASYDMDIEPDDIRVSDTVTVVWEIA